MTPPKYTAEEILRMGDRGPEPPPPGFRMTHKERLETLHAEMSFALRDFDDADKLRSLIRGWCSDIDRTLRWPVEETPPKEPVA